MITEDMQDQPGKEDPAFGKAQHIAALLAGYIRQSLTPAQHDELDEWVGASEKNMRLFEELTDEKKMQEALDWLEDVDAAQALKKTKARLEFARYYQPGRLFSMSWHYVAAACLLLVIGAAAFFIYSSTTKTKDNNSLAIAPKPDLQPGKPDKAYLTLADGSMIVLDQMKDGTIASQGASDIIKKDGQLQYNPKTGATGEALYNTVTTPRGGSYPLTLSDGTKIWLNAASSIRYPSVFKGAERRVVITGEVYFEVAKNKAMPFIVDIKDKGTSVQVLGTHFNINAYADEAVVRTTLLEGAVKVSKQSGSPAVGSKTAFLKPGQQAEVGDGDIKVDDNADIDAVMAWKNGMFRFNNADIVTIMKQAARWYDVEISYEANVTTTTYNCILPRDIPASRLFTVLEQTGGVHFKIDGKKVSVLP